jgi:adenosylmethionine-8-amino-7-oxononanoate aminotransferase
VFFAESGSVSVEIAMKMALQFHINQGRKGADEVPVVPGRLSRRHPGDDDGLRSGGGHAQPVLRRDAVAGDRRPAGGRGGRGGAGRLLAERGGEIAAILTEPLVQGAGGMLFHSPEVLRTLRRLADKHGVLLIFDEIFTGFGRTGDAVRHAGGGVEPDIVTLSKALTGGTLPLSAAVASTGVRGLLVRRRRARP